MIDASSRWDLTKAMLAVSFVSVFAEKEVKSFRRFVGIMLNVNVSGKIG